ncbi:hypothetical protein [Paenibacillus sp. MMS20-IR301]|nr:hypothetical protein [Paenibacillus sp. MMS20-IR301]WNS43148.1 hypothetical protein LOS79_30105 [Paenibacillus sp. MMS20-IR301]
MNERSRREILLLRSGKASAASQPASGRGSVMLHWLFVRGDYLV